MKSLIKRRGLGLVPALAVIFLTSVTAFQVKAAPVGASNAFGLQADLEVLNLVGVSAGPFAGVAGASPGAYDNSNMLLSVDEGLNLSSTVLGDYVQGLHTGLIETNVNSSIPGPTQAGASAEINDLNLGLNFNSILPIDPLAILGLSADTIVSSSEVLDSGGLVAMGDTQIEGLGLSSVIIDLLGVDLGLAINPDANTTLVDLLGLKIVLNEQFSDTLGGSGLRQETNAIHVSFDNFGLGVLGLDPQLLNGDIYVGHTYAEVAILDDPVNDVPEPAALSIFGMGLIGLGFGLRRRRRHFA